MSSVKPLREVIARTLCQCDGHPEDIGFDGRKMWESYLPEADAVIQALGAEGYLRVSSTSIAIAS